MTIAETSDQTPDAGAVDGFDGFDGFSRDGAPEGAAVLDEARALLAEYVILPSAEALDAVVLWCAATHVLSAFEYAPRLVIRSAEKGSGKSRLLELVDALVHQPLRSVNASISYVFRKVGAEAENPPTLLLDEADTIFKAGKHSDGSENLRGLLNAGFQRGMMCGRVGGQNNDQTKEYGTFAMAALCGIGRMPDTIENRAVVVAMRRRKPTEHVRPYRTRRDRPRFDQLRERLAAWAEVIRDRLDGYLPENMGVEDRAADTWEPLITVADAAGGDWPVRARRAARVMVAAAAEDDADESEGIRLLIDIRNVFAETGSAFLRSEHLCSHLRSIAESPWGDTGLTPRKLGWRLREYGIKADFEDATHRLRGYRLDQFTDAFERYAPAGLGISPETIEDVA
ncbi:DUF3631 domain-containing protein [Nocardia terpenica]|uniref:DUF3631 domain-containing protein n=1 Tax=Nocardia terpenica TaxID=455432 RepID=A0A291RCA8_9NOCA|nr:DUF3631 domain-containing protein [Nocardia terpenica]ATL64929.1 hypothetical protein CRH09_00450 [Nocardia terpenica]